MREEWVRGKERGREVWRKTREDRDKEKGEKKEGNESLGMEGG